MDYRINGLPDPPFVVRTAGHVVRRPFHSSPGTRGDDFMLLAVLAGSGSFTVGDKVTPLHSGLVGLVRPEQPGLLMSDSTRPYSLCYCRFNGNYAKALAARILDREAATFFAWPRAREIGNLIRRMGYQKRLTPPTVMGQPEVLLAECLIMLADGPLAPSDPDPLNKFAIRDWMHSHTDQPTKLDAMAESFGVSRATLCRITRRLTGSSPQVLHERIKMDWARHLLLHTGLSIKEIAHRLGYADSLYFTRVFRRRFRTCPTGFRQRRRRVGASPT